MKTSVFIPTRNPGYPIIELVESLLDQTYALDEIIIIDSSSTDKSISRLRKYFKSYVNKLIKIETISPNQFGHGKTRNRGVRIASGDLIIFLSQDVEIKDSNFVKNITRPLLDDAEKEYAATFARQIAKTDHHPLEKFFYNFYFPKKEITHAKIKDTELVMADIFFSNAASCIKRDMLIQNPFDEQIIMAEDQKFALDILNKGYKILYIPEAKVLHSHNYSLRDNYRRYFDCAVAFSHIIDKPSFNMILFGSRYVFREFLYVITHNPKWLFTFLKNNLAKVLATISAIVINNYPKLLEKSTIKKMSMHSYYWIK